MYFCEIFDLDPFLTEGQILKKNENSLKSFDLKTSNSEDS